ncbi:unnamed protein product [Adineta ricciae]|uniref:Uncharacterized protein n=1 Tax=Adineta ricciae TaxID=249248 RepID=A0A815U9U1_ADIRI|nr:unnamed protein product [Adineta ricciae]CAF1518272.1 unnamed protein product [Adineta ricciae]
MSLLYLFISFTIHTGACYRLNMYNVDQALDNHCLDYIVNFASPWQQQIISFCFRPSTQSERISYLTWNNTADRHFTFEMLYEENITSQDLLQWSATVDLAERYQIYLERKKDFASFEDEQYLFYNCSWPWFGPLCQFSFGLFSDGAFGIFVRSIFTSRELIVNGSMIACYSHLKCETLFTCLDWRDICDGEMDCLDGTDESGCWPLEMNECSSDEFRCHNGQCISAVFLADEPVNADCLDRSDEPLNTDFSETCFNNPSFACEERMCRPGKQEFPCGDGQCIGEVDRICLNGKRNFLSNDSCLNAMNCLLDMIGYDEEEWCDRLCPDVRCMSEYCPDSFEFPAEPVLFGHVRLIFETEKLIDNVRLPSYVCYNEELCKDFLSPTIYINGSACRHLSQLNLSTIQSSSIFSIFVRTLKHTFRSCAVIPSGIYDCNHKNAYQCKNSTKCISKYRLVDGISDCLHGDDEEYKESCELNDHHHRFRCFDDKKRCFARLVVRNGHYECHGNEDEATNTALLRTRRVYFPTLCDGHEELTPIVIDGRNETDETECEHWPCNNTYNRCDGVWHCHNGADEVSCPGSICPPLQHMCVLPSNLSELGCVSIDQAGDGSIDCLGASDERQYCRMNYALAQDFRFRCWNDTICVGKNFLCDGVRNCKFHDDEQFCTSNTIPLDEEFCDDPKTKLEKFICHFSDISRSEKFYLVLQNMQTYPPSLKVTDDKIERFPIATRKPFSKSTIDNDIESEWIPRCNRGLNIRVRIDNSGNELQRCLCPPGYYGDTCQYQNQRVSVTFQVRVGSDGRTLFSIFILLIDHEGKVHSYDQVQYLPSRDCYTKFHIILLYATRPKNNSKNYSVRIDVFNTITLNYRASWIFPILFPFLPVYSLAVQLLIPNFPVQPTQHCPLLCIHGQCIKYTNTEKTFFCRCDHGWSGNDCSIAQHCNCSPDSLCIDQPICVCPVGKFGSGCYLKQISCKYNECLNNGQCVPDDPRHELAENENYRHGCICSEEYEGIQCDYHVPRLDVSFAGDFIIPDSLFIHFVGVNDHSPHGRTTLLKRIPLHQTKLTVYAPIDFNAAFAQFDNKYYLIVLRESFIYTGNISTQISNPHQCVPIQELFNTTMVNRHLLRRIKHYHTPCQQRKELVCFYDEVHFCLCDLSRNANCFEFDFNMTHHCQGLNPCENGGHCFNDYVECPLTTICVCDTCFYGSRCQFSTKSFRPSLDAILGYQIRPKIPFNQQPAAVKVSVALTIIIFGLGLVNGFLLLVTFRKKEIRNIGCDIYLLTSSIVSIIIINAFSLKTCFLLLAQMNLITNHSFILFQCRSMDFLLRIFLSTSDWLHACVATERIMIISKGTTFDKRKSKNIAKWIISFVLLVVICTNIQEPLHRQLMDDEEEQRIWCVIKLSPSVQLFDSIIVLFHFLVPFSLNIVSALVIILVTARTRLNIKRKQTYKEHFYEQLQTHKHLLISPSILILLASPRLIISFLSECMKSVRDPWLFLSGYFISFIAPIATFAVFVLPSQTYKQQFLQSAKSLCYR